MKERRHKLRVTSQLEIRYSIAQGFLKSGSRSKNISEVGLAMPTIQKLEPGVLLDVEIRLAEGKKPIVGCAEVVWSATRDDSRHPFEAGIKFIEFAEKDLDLLMDVVKKVCAEQGIDYLKWTGE
ncbi:MAG: PilZ domain-containing protein [Candidatus Omnitrophica bacterium]|nr:PilZ domain-containing protein [Candidatus Omnitrophota bacterium]